MNSLTVLAGIWLLACVSPQMNVELVATIEGFFTYGADERSLASVDAHMAVEILLVGGGELASYVFTLELLNRAKHLLNAL